MPDSVGDYIPPENPAGFLFSLSAIPEFAVYHGLTACWAGP